MGLSNLLPSLMVGIQNLDSAEDLLFMKCTENKTNIRNIIEERNIRGLEFIKISPADVNPMKRSLRKIISVCILLLQKRRETHSEHLWLHDNSLISFLSEIIGFCTC